MNTSLVRFVCRAKGHVDATPDPTAEVGSPVTIHSGAWAYCTAGAHSEHDWEEIEPVSLTELKLINVGRPREAAAEDSRT
jgi:hypothetical protein